MASTFTLQLDTTGPGGVTFNVNSGAAYATQRPVTAQIGTSDGVTAGYQMKVWGDVDGAADPNVQPTEGASSWIGFASSLSVTLSAADALKTLNVRVRDDVGNQSAPVSKTITLDTSLPVATISVAASPTKVSKTPGFDTTSFSFQSDSASQAWKVKVVPSTGSTEAAGTVIPTAGGSSGTTGGALAANTNQNVTLKGVDVESASAGDGNKIIKVFVQDQAGNWSV